MSSQAEKLHAKLDEIAERATQATRAMTDIVQASNAKTQRIVNHERAHLELIGRTMREGSQRIIPTAE